MTPRNATIAACLALPLFGASLAAGMSRGARSDPTGGNDASAGARGCQLVQSGSGPAGAVNVKAEKWVTGLEVPWSLAFLPDGNALVTERPGRIRLIRRGKLEPRNVAVLPVSSATSEGGLLGLAVDPDFRANRYFYVYSTIGRNASTVTNQVQRFVLSSDESTAKADKVLIDGIPGAAIHDGGRIGFGPDKKLYIATGDATHPERAQDKASLSGKILRIDADGSIPGDNPMPGHPWFLLGLRNAHGFGWLSASKMIIADNGPTGEGGRTGADEVSAARKGDNLGWPTIYRCEAHPGMVTPLLSWRQAAPPGGALLYRGDVIPEWKGDFLVGMLGFAPEGANQLHRLILAKDGSGVLLGHETYFQNRFGRLRDVVQGPDGAIYVTTSNCDGRGKCPPDKDVILRIHSG